MPNGEAGFYVKSVIEQQQVILVFGNHEMSFWIFAWDASISSRAIPRRAPCRSSTPRIRTTVRSC